MYQFGWFRAKFSHRFFFLSDSVIISFTFPRREFWDFVRGGTWLLKHIGRSGNVSFLIWTTFCFQSGSEISSGCSVTCSNTWKKEKKINGQANESEKLAEKIDFDRKSAFPPSRFNGTSSDTGFAVTEVERGWERQTIPESAVDGTEKRWKMVWPRPNDALSCVFPQFPSNVYQNGGGWESYRRHHWIVNWFLRGKMAF